MLTNLFIILLADLDNDEELQLMETEIQEIRSSNTEIESQIVQLRSEVVTLETQVQQEERENNAIEEQTNSLTEYLNSLKKKVISILSNLNLPQFNSNAVNEDNLEACINQLQNLCSVNTTGDTILYSTMNLSMSEIQVA